MDDVNKIIEGISKDIFKLKDIHTSELEQMLKELQTYNNGRSFAQAVQAAQQQEVARRQQERYTRLLEESGLHLTASARRYYNE